jgi:hypothetical protein
MPEAGSQRSFTAKRRIIIMPRKNDGTEIPKITAKVIARSAAPYWRAAETTPAAMPRIAQSTKAVPARISVAEKRSRISSSTGRFSAKDRPRSPCSRLPIQTKYCCQSGRSSPRWRFSRSTFSGVA